MNKYTTKLTADTSQHDKAIKKSANEIYQYNKNIDNAKKTLGTLVNKFGAIGAAIGAGVGALSTFGTALKGIESVADSTARTQETLTYSIKQFFLSLSSGSFDSFLNGLSNIINKAKEAYDAVDSLRTFQSFNSVDLAQNLTKQNQLNLDIKKIQAGIIEDPDGTLLKQKQSELKKLQNERLSLVNQEIAHYDKAIKAQDNKIKALLTTPHAKELYQKFTKSGASYDEVEDATNAAEAAWAAIEAERANAATSSDGQTLLAGADRDWYKKNKERYDSIHEEYQVMQQIKNLESDIVAKKQLEIEKEKAKQDLIATESPTIETLRESSIKTPTPATIETVDELTNLISQKKQELENLKTQYANNLVRLFANTENKEIQNSLLDLNEDLKNQIKHLSKDINVWEELINEAFNTVETSISPNSLTALEKLLKTLEENRLRRIEKDDVGIVHYYSEEIKKLQEQIKNKKIELGLIEPDNVEEDVKIIEYTIGDAYSAITNLYNSINSLGNAIGDAFDSDEIREFFNALQSGLNVINAVYSIFEAFNKVMEVSNVLKATSNTLTKEGTTAAAADIAVQTADASAKASGAIAGATAAGAWIPFPYNLIAIAGGIAAVVSALALMGNYADGGIIGGNTTVGDHGLARVNAGEMILNSREQNRLWNVLNGASLNNGSIGGEVRFEIEGSRLVGVLNNYESKKGRIR